MDQEAMDFRGGSTKVAWLNALVEPPSKYLGL